MSEPDVNKLRIVAQHSVKCGTSLSYCCVGVLNYFNKHTYITGHYNPSVSISDLVSHTTYVVCVNFIHKWRDLQFKVDTKRQIFWETFHGSFYLLSEFLPETCWEEIAEKIWWYCIHTYIHNWSGLHPSFSHHLYCVWILYIKGWTYSFNLTPKDRYLRNFSRQFYLLGNRRRNIFSYFCFDFPMHYLGDLKKLWYYSK